MIKEHLSLDCFVTESSGRPRALCIVLMRPWRYCEHSIFNDITDEIKRGIIQSIEKIVIRNWRQLIHLSSSHQNIFAKAKQADTRCASRMAPVLAKAGKTIDGSLNI